MESFWWSPGTEGDKKISFEPARFQRISKPEHGAPPPFTSTVPDEDHHDLVT